jgi:Trk K+ transport system NAD-binding subunit
MIDLYEFVVPEHLQGRMLREVLPEGHYVVVACTRTGKPLPPAQELLLEAGDVIYLSSAPEGRETLRRWLAAQQKG